MVNGGKKSTPILDKVTKSLIKEAHKSKLGIPLCHGEWWGEKSTPWFFRHSRPSWIRLPWWMVGARNPPLILSALQAILDKVTKSLITNQNLECLSAMVNGGGEKSTPWFFRHSRPSWTRSPKAWSRKPTNLNLEFLSAMVNGGGEKSTPWFFRHSRPSWTRSPKAWSRKPTNLNLEFLSAMVNGGGKKFSRLRQNDDASRLGVHFGPK